MKENNSGGVKSGFLGMLTILFIGLKLTNHIKWAWFLVLSPILIPLIFVGGIFLIAIITLGLKALLKI